MAGGYPCPKIYPDEKFKDGITNGAQWYVIHGGMQDWNYLHTNCFEITLELGCVKYPPASTLPKYWDDNRDALIKFMQQVRSSIILKNKFKKFLRVPYHNLCILNLIPTGSHRD